MYIDDLTMEELQEEVMGDTATYEPAIQQIRGFIASVRDHIADYYKVVETYQPTEYYHDHYDLNPYLSDMTTEELCQALVPYEESDPTEECYLLPETFIQQALESVRELEFFLDLAQENLSEDEYEERLEQFYRSNKD